MLTVSLLVAHIMYYTNICSNLSEGGLKYQTVHKKGLLT